MSQESLHDRGQAASPCCSPTAGRLGALVPLADKSTLFFCPDRTRHPMERRRPTKGETAACPSQSPTTEPHGRSRSKPGDHHRLLAPIQIGQTVLTTLQWPFAEAWSASLGRQT